MVTVIDALICLVCGLALLVILRWMWFRRERRRLASVGRDDDDERFERMRGDEDDQAFSGRVVKRLRSRVIDGRIEIDWQFRKEYIHRGFLLTGKCRRNDGGWEPLAFEPYEDSGSWHECFNYGESRTYVFIVKKKYHMFWGLFGSDDVEIAYDQISFSVRKGKALKEKKELIRDRKELLMETRDYVRLVAELRQLARQHGGGHDTLPDGDPKVAKLRQSFGKQSAMSDALDQMIDEVNANPNWTQERKAREIERLRQLAEEAALED